jgi:type I restriction enzyme M protein
MFLEDSAPYGSYGNGSAMRVSPVAWAAESLEEALRFSDEVTAVSHDHPEGLKGARAVAACAFLARTGADKAAIRDYVREHFYPLEETLAEIRPEYGFDETCQGSVPQAIQAFLEAESFEDAIRNAVSLGGDSDTQAAIAGSIAEAYFGVPEELREKALTYLTEELREVLFSFESLFGADPEPAPGS